MTNDVFTWSPFIALVIGAFCTLGLFRSRTWGMGLVSAALILQVAAWTCFFLVGDVWQHGWTANWDGVLTAGFMASLIVVFPYTVIGAVCGGTMFLFARWSVREEVQEAREDAIGYKKTLARHPRR